MIDAEPVSAHAEALLTATNEFLRTDDLQALARALVAAAETMFAPTKSAVIVRGRDGSHRPIATFGHEHGATARPVERGRLAAELIERALDGHELCTDDPGSEDFMSQVRAYGGASGLALPIRVASGPVGVLVVIHEAPVPFDPTLRELARNLCAQAGLAIELLEVRQDLRRQTRLASALLAVSQRLSTLTDPDDVPGELVAAIRSATGASIAIVARWCEPENRVEFTAIEGLSDAEAQALRDIEPIADGFGMVQSGLKGVYAVLVPPFDPADVPVELLTALRLTAVAGAPIAVADRTWGFLLVATRAGDPSIVEAGAELLAGFASLTATALGRTAAMAELERSHEVLETTVAERTRELTRVVQELRLASQAKTEFLSNVSHELRTPLTSILGFADLLLHGLEGPLTPAQHEDLRTIEISGDRLLALIDELIDVSRIEADEVELDVAPVKLGLFLDGIIAEAKPRADQKSISLDLFLGTAPETVLMDPVRVGAIIVNLLSNAVKFTGPGGAIVVEAGLAPDGSLRIDVADNGIGIPPGQREKIFEKFHRVAGPDLPGTGLGLSIAREYARLHGGDVTVESTPGVGSRFSLRIPLETTAGGHA